MIKETLSRIYEMDLQKVIQEIKLYENEADLWKLPDGITNSGGNLALHLIGNIKHFFGAVLGETGYKRERDLEFSNKNVSRAEIINGLNEAIKVLKTTLNDMTDDDFQTDYPMEFGGEIQKTFSVIVYMLSHLNFHLGQINYHRRLLQNK